MRGAAPAFADRHYRLFAAAVLVLAAFNLTYRLGQEFVSDWDEALYGLSAAEMLVSDQWVATTTLGTLDYYDTKPPLNVWLIASAFNVFGIGLVSLRIVSVTAAWLTVVLLQWWVRRIAGSAAAILSSLVLATTFAFIHVHAGKSANTDAVFTLLVLATVVVTWESKDDPWRQLWLAPLLAAAFLLRGMAVLMPLLIVAVVESARCQWDRLRSKRPLVLAVMLGMLPVSAWVAARLQIDGATFLEELFFHDFVARSRTALEGHAGTAFYYLNILQKNQFDWLFVAIALWTLRATTPGVMRLWLARRRDPDSLVVFAAWAGATLLVPTLMQTKTAWYLNPFYPLFAVWVSAILLDALRGRPRLEASRRRGVVMAIAITVVAAEGRLIWYSHDKRDLNLSWQGWLLAERASLRGHRLFRDEWTDGDRLVAQHVVAAIPRDLGDKQLFCEVSASGDYFLSSAELVPHRNWLVRTDGRRWVYRHGP